METKILAATKENIALCAGALGKGELVAFPTETVYGLGGNALDKDAAAKIYSAKGRPSDNPLIVHVPDLDSASPFVESIPESARLLARRFLPGPLTLIMKKNDAIPSAVTGGLDTVAVRVPNHPIALALLKAVKLPVCAPSANLSGSPSPTSARHVYGDLSGKIPYILDGGSCMIGLESTIVDLTSPKPRLLRPGAIDADRLKKTLGELETVTDSKVALCPGMKYKHYAPKAQVLFSAYYEDMASQICLWYDKLKENGKRPVILCLSGNAAKYGKRALMKMGGNFDEYAHNLFSCLRSADDRGYDAVIAEGVSPDGIGGALINRLIKSSGGQII